MPPHQSRDRITDQFSHRGTTADIWQAFDLILDTDAYLNLGYSPWYLPHVVGSSQQRLTQKIGDLLTTALGSTTGVTLLDVGCGRGGPAIQFATEFGFQVIGLDLVPYNIHEATQAARTSGTSADFVVSDATHLPFQSGSVGACTAIDALVYLGDRSTVFEEIASTLTSDGVFVLSDLFRSTTPDSAARSALESFADAWDMAIPGTTEGYVRELTRAGFEITDELDITRHSVGRFRKWTTLFLGLTATPLGTPIKHLLERYDLDADTIIQQVTAAHHALPFLEHHMIVAER